MSTPPTTTAGSAPIVIVGGGPTGLTAAILLAQHGLPVTILERHREPYPHPRAVHLDDEVHRILQQVGVAPAFARISRPGAGMRVLDADQGVLAEFRRSPRGPHGYPQANMFDQPDLEQLLRDRLASHHPEVVFHRGIEVTDVRTAAPGSVGSAGSDRSVGSAGSDRSVGSAGSDRSVGSAGSVRAVVSFRDAGVADAPVRQIEAAAVLGCDGATSIVRLRMGITWRDLGFEQRWLVVDGRCPHPLAAWDGVDHIADPRRAATFMRVGDDRYRWEFRLHADDDEEALQQPAELRRLLSPWLAGLPPGAVELLRSAGYTFRARVARRWRSGRVLLLGDAAHLTPPFIGQGLGAGLRDASNLSWKLARVLTGDAPDSLLDSYESERRPHVTRQIRLARTVGWALTGTGRDAGGSGDAARRWALRAILRVSRLAPGVLDRGSPALRASCLTAGRRTTGPRSLIGTLVPQPDVLDGEVTRALDEILGLRTAVLTLTAPDPELLALAARIGARVLYVDGCPLRGTSPTPGVRTIDGGGTLARWLGDARATAAVVRPDRVVVAVARSPTRPGRELAASAACGALAMTSDRSLV